jgi:hypothetical protein
MLRHSIVSQHFMESEGSIPNSQELSTCSYPEPDQSSPHHPFWFHKMLGKYGVASQLVASRVVLSSTERENSVTLARAVT